MNEKLSTYDQTQFGKQIIPAAAFFAVAASDESTETPPLGAGTQRKRQRRLAAEYACKVLTQPTRLCLQLRQMAGQPSG